MEGIAWKLWTSVAGDIMLSVVLVKGAILASVVAGLGLVTRRTSAGRRSNLWTAGFLALLVLPFLVPRLPVWEIGLAEFPRQLFDAEASAGASAVPAIPTIAWLTLIWLTGALFLLGRFALDVARIARVSRAADLIGEGALAEMAGQIGRQLGVRRVRVGLSDNPGVPLTWGLRRPMILLPRTARSWPRDLQRAVLQHEMAHVARHDYLSLVVMELCRAVHWMNPIVWYLSRQARLDQERACDDAAIRSGIAGPDYARHLVAVARSFALGSPYPAGALPIVRASSLRQRVQAVMERGTSRKPATLGTAFAAIAVVAATALPVAAANLWICEDLRAEPTSSRVASESPRPTLQTVLPSPRLARASRGSDSPLTSPSSRSLPSEPPAANDCSES